MKIWRRGFREHCDECPVSERKGTGEHMCLIVEGFIALCRVMFRRFVGIAACIIRVTKLSSNGSIHILSHYGGDVSYDTSKPSLAYTGSKSPEDPHFPNVSRGSLIAQENLLTGSADMDEILPLRSNLEHALRKGDIIEDSCRHRKTEKVFFLTTGHVRCVHHG